MSRLFTLLLGLLGAVNVGATLNPGRSKVAPNILEGKPDGSCNLPGPIEATNCAYETIEALNKELFPAVHDLVSTPFFKYYKVNLFRQCPFWSDNGGLCMNRACAVQEVNESEIPEKWRARALGQVSLPAEGYSGCFFRYDDFCPIEDDASPGGQYIDLTLNPERFTGYAGDGAHDIWRAIYQENCFGLSETSIAAAKSGRGRSHAPEGFGLAAGMMHERKHGLAPAEMCEEKKLYYRLISGLHASISVHICAEYLDRATGQWAPNLDCFIWRLAKFPERLSNVYFNVVLLLRAVARAAPYFHAYDIGITPPTLCSDHDAVDTASRAAFERVLSLAERSDIASSFAEDVFFNSPDAPVIMDQFKSHFHNVSRIMDCVGCDKCRLWGKLQVSGFGTALKILFALDDRDLDPKRNPDLLQRSELVALFNTLHRVAESLDGVQTFRKMYADRLAAEAAEASGAAEAAESAGPEQTEAEVKAVHARKLEGPRHRASVPTSKELITTHSLWLNSGATIGTAVLALLEALRRSCKDCVGYVARWLTGTGKVEL